MTVVSMRGDDAAPHDTILARRSARSLLINKALVDVGYALAHVELGVLPILHTLNLKARLAAVLIAAVALVAKMNCL